MAEVGRFQVVPAAYVVFLREGGGDREVLLQLRRNTGYRDGHWACAAAGHVEAGESAVAAAAREAYEELGVEIAEGDLVPLTAMHRTHGNGHAIDERVDFFFTCSRWKGEPRLREKGKAEAVSWFPLSTLPSPMVPHEAVVLAMLSVADAAGASDGPPTGAMPAIVTFGFA